MRVCLAVLLLLLAFVASCASERQDADGPMELGAGGAWLLDVESHHERIDAAVARGDFAEAAREAEAALGVAVPVSVAAAHRRSLHQDLAFRLAGAWLSAGQFDRALEASERGLALGRHDDLFTANLLFSAGRALEALGRDSDAVARYHDALKINEALLRQVLDADGGADP